MSNAFFIGYGFSKYHLPNEFIGQWTTVMMAGQIIGSLLMGHIGDHYGYRRALLMASVCMILTITAAFVFGGPVFYGIVFLFLGMNLGMDMMSRFNMAIEIAPDNRRPVYVALLNTVVAPFYLLSLAAGALIKSIGYEGIFALSALFAAGACGWLLLYVKDPRDLHV
jgi:MFS family permease